MASAKESARLKLVALVTIIYLLLIFEGVLRKWVFPSLSQVLFFIRDPFVLAVYWLALRHGFFPKSSPLLIAGVTISFCGLLLAATQLLVASGSVDGALLLAGYGWRNYFLYLPLAFVIGEVFTRRDLLRIAKITLLLAVPVSALMFLQFMSPLDSPINVGFGEAQFRGLTVDEVHTRPMGLFTSDQGQRLFTVSALAMALALWLTPAARRHVKLWQLLPGTAAVLACLAISGSRGAMVAAGLVAIGAVACAVVIRGGGVSARAVIWPSLIVVAAAFLYPIVFPEQYQAFMFRWDHAAQVESRHFQLGILGRALYGFVDFMSLMGDAPLVGYGLGFAGNARQILNIEIGFTGWAETDWARHIVDLGPVMGIVFMAYRVVLVSWLGMRCLSGARRAADPTAILLFAFVGVELLYGQISGHGTVNGYTWLFAGFCLAAAASRQPDVAQDAAKNAAKEAVAPSRRFANLMP